MKKLKKFLKNLLTNAKTYGIIEVQNKRGQTHRAFEKTEKIFEKPIDKCQNICYNRGTKTREDRRAERLKKGEQDEKSQRDVDN